jgi:hypothetical protein
MCNGESLLLDGRHPFFVCESCGDDINDRLMFEDNGLRNITGLAPQDFCYTCRQDIEFYE